jgi:hypothetical protein
MRVVISGYRYYSAEMGRWLSRDPIEEDGGINLYVFTANSPNNTFDLWGLNIGTYYGIWLGQYLHDQGIKPGDYFFGTERNYQVNIPAWFFGPVVAAFCDLTGTATLHNKEDKRSCLTDVDLAVGISCGLKKLLTSRAGKIPVIGKHIKNFSKSIPDLIQVAFFVETAHVWGPGYLDLTWPETAGLHASLISGHGPHGSTGTYKGSVYGGTGLYIEGDVTWDFSSFMPSSGDIVVGFAIQAGYDWVGGNLTWEGSLGEMLGWK